MAIFRAITAEEEAASGIMYALREVGYKHSHSLKPKSHVHKHAVYPFLRVLGLFNGQIFEKTLKNYRLHIKDELGERRLMLSFPTPFIINSEDHWAYPIPPLNFGVKIDNGERPPSYESQISALVESVGAKDILSYLKTEANLRNKFLYAAPDGYPSISDLKVEYINEKYGHVMALLQTYLLIRPWREVQPYVQDCISAFLTMVGSKNFSNEVQNEA